MTKLPGSPPGPETVLQRVGSPELEFVDVDGETVVYHCAKRSLHLLNPVATLIWLGMDGRSTLRELSARLAEEFHQPPTEVLDHVLTLAARFTEIDLVDPR